MTTHQVTPPTHDAPQGVSAPVPAQGAADRGMGRRGAAAMRIAIVCDNASFRMGGEAAIPLRFFREFRRMGHDVLVLTHERVRDELASTLPPEDFGNIVFFEDRTVQRRLWQVGRALPSRMQEIFISGAIEALTQRRQSAHLRRLVDAGRVDVVFAPIPISPRAVSLLARLRCPTFFGPLNGDMSYPPGMRPGTNRATESLISVARVAVEPLHYIFPARRRATGLFVANPRTLRALPRACRGTATFKSFDATIDGDLWASVDRTGEIERGHFLYVGRLVDWKAVDHAIRAVQRLKGRARLTIVGDGPERPALERLVAGDPATRGCFTFTGHLPHARMTDLYARVTALVLPSLREAGGNVCMEALASGVPVIATRWGGPEDVVEDNVDGVLVAPQGAAAFVAGLAAAMERFLDDPSLSVTMGEAGRRRVLAAFSWRTKAADYARIFEASLDPATAASWTDAATRHAHPRHAEGEACLAWREPGRRNRAASSL